MPEKFIDPFGLPLTITRDGYIDAYQPLFSAEE